jgi:7-alpha-hydroxysteroid dehydrogenase
MALRVAASRGIGSPRRLPSAKLPRVATAGSAGMTEFTDRSVIVTGAARGIGLAIARRFVRAGASVVMADMDEARLELEVEALNGEGNDGRCLAVVGDLREKLTMTNLVAATLDAFDGVDVLVNASRVIAPSEPLSPDRDGLEATLTRNVLGTVRLSQIAARRMIELRSGETEPRDRAIVNISSVQALRTSTALMAYSIGCAAIEQATRTLALALAPHRIRVNALAVGGVAGRSLAAAMPTIADLPEALADITPLGRIADAADFAGAALFLASPSAGFVTGQVVTVDGGRSLVDPLSVWAE